MICKNDKCAKEVDDNSKYCKYCAEPLVLVGPYGQAKVLTNRAYEKLKPILYEFKKKETRRNVYDLDEEEIPNVEQLREVIQLEDSAIALVKDWPSPFLYRGIAKFIKGDHGGAFRDVKEAESKNPAYEKALGGHKIIEAKIYGNDDEYQMLLRIAA